MRGLKIAAGAFLVVGMAGTALAQDVVSQRRDGLKGVGQTMEAVAQAVRGGADTRALVPRIEAMQGFFQTLPNLVPTPSLTPPQPQGTGEGQTRALAAIDGNRADFQTRTNNMLTALATLQTAAATGSISADLLRSTGGTCGACHQQYRAR